MRAKIRGPELEAQCVAEPYLADHRFRALLGANAWANLPAAVRARFAKRLRPGLSVSYSGEVTVCTMSRAGWLLAQLCRLIGAPLPLGRETGLAAVVTVTEDASSGGQTWSRMYARRHTFPQVIHSAKRFAGPTGLEEYLGAGFGISLTIAATASGICFCSDHYFLMICGKRLRLPHWLGPGALRIDHDDLGGGRFAFTLSLRHWLLGEIIHQAANFRDPPGAGIGDA